MGTATLNKGNFLGHYPDTIRCLHHNNLGYEFVLLTKLLEPNIIVINGINVLDDHVPMSETPKKLDLLVGANNPVVADLLGTQLMGISPEFILHIKITNIEYLGEIDHKIVLVNSNFQQYISKFPVQKAFIDKFSTLLFTSDICAKLVIDSKLSPAIYSLASMFRNSNKRKYFTDLKKS